MTITGSLGIETEDADAALRWLADLLRPYLTDADDKQPEALLTADQIAGALQVHRDTVVRWARERRISATKVGREWRFPAGAKPGSRDRQPEPAARNRRAGAVARRATDGSVARRPSAEPASLAAIREGEALQ
jgi:excisionase family DNA binding protein